MGSPASKPARKPALNESPAPVVSTTSTSKAGECQSLIAGAGVGTLPPAFEDDQRAKFRQAGQGSQRFCFTGQLAGLAQVGGEDISLAQGLCQAGIGQGGRGVLAIDENPATLLVSQLHQRLAFRRTIKRGVDHPARALRQDQFLPGEFSRGRVVNS